MNLYDIETNALNHEIPLLECDVNWRENSSFKILFNTEGWVCIVGTVNCENESLLCA